MVGNLYASPGPLRSGLRREASVWWWVPLVTGVAWFAIGWAVLRADVVSLATVGVLVGVAFLGIALSELSQFWMFSGGWRVVHALVSGLFLVGAMWAFIRPIETFFALASVLGLLIFVQGVSSITQAIVLRDVSPFWGVMLFAGILLTALGLWASSSDGVWTLAARSAFVLLWVGCMAVFRGVHDVTFGLTLRDVSKWNERPRLSADDRAAVPPQRDALSRQQTPVLPAG